MKQVLALGVLTLTFACSEGSQFSGAASKGAPKEPVPIPAATADTVPYSTVGEGAQQPTAPKPTTVSEEAALPPLGESITVESSNTTIPTTVDGSTKTPEVTPPTVEGITNSPTGVEFGATGVFRVGDGDASGTSCKEAVFSYKLEGFAYSFLFEVTEDNTSIDVFVNRLCGLDYDYNHLSVVRVLDGGTLATRSLGLTIVDVGSAPLRPLPSKLILQKGSYAIVVQADVIDAELGRDDFIIGNIKIIADKTVYGTAIETK